MTPANQKMKTIGRVALDSKNRLSLTKALKHLAPLPGARDLACLTFRVQVSESGEVLLSPEVSLPLSEAWLYEDPQALQSVKRGLQEAEEGKLAARGSFRQFAEDEIE